MEVEEVEGWVTAATDCFFAAFAAFGVFLSLAIASRVVANWVEGDELELLLNSHEGGPDDAEDVTVLLGIRVELFDMARESSFG